MRYVCLYLVCEGVLGNNFPYDLGLQAGGKLVFIRSGKPFLRGGEGGSRNSAVRAKQLNYSRAFGCAPLKE